MQTTSSERSLHPASVLFDIGLVGPRMVLPFAVALFTGAGAARFIWILLPLLLGIVIVGSIVRWLRFRYRYDETELVVHSGLLFRNERRIPYARIQNLDASQNIVHRILGVVMVSVQTGGGALPEAVMRVLPVSALDEMRARLAAAAHGTPVATPEPETAEPEAARRTLLQLSPRELLVAGFIENRGLVMILGAFALLQELATDAVVERLVSSDTQAAIARATGNVEISLVQGAVYVVLLVLGLLLFVRLLSVVWALVRLYGFRLDLAGDELHMEYGLLTRVTATIPLRRVQTILVSDGWLHRMLEKRSVTVETAGGLAGVTHREPIAPVIDAGRVAALLHEIQPGLDVESIDWQPVHPRAFGRILRGAFVLPLVLGALAYYVVREWAAGLWILLVAYAVIRARLRARNLGWSLRDDHLAVRDGAITRTVRVARFNRLQVAAVRRNPFDLRLGMASVRADTAGAAGNGSTIPYLPHEQAVRLQHALAARAAETGFTW